MAVEALNEKLNEIDISKCTREELKSVADELSDAMESYVLSSTPRGPNTNAFEEKLNALELKLKELDTKHHDPPKIVFRK
jgi:uncharacterized coiled-coil DUF342 family protein